jgi:hypothetical protein
VSETTADWRRWAILSVLYEAEMRARGSRRTKDILHDIEDAGWDVLPKNGRMDAVHASCMTWTKGAFPHSDVGAMVRRLDYRPIRWELTASGRDFTTGYLIGNPHITPEKSVEARQEKIGRHA